LTTKQTTTKQTTTRKKRRKSRPKYTARTADKHTLYQLSVQDPEGEVALISRIFKRTRDRHALTLREDFCGTAAFCAEWIRSRRGRTAVGLDLDPDVLAWGVEHNLAPVGEPGNRIKLLERNVLKPPKGPFDITVGFNFSYWIFKQRDVMLKYFKGVHRNLSEDGMFFVDTYGGPGAIEPQEESRPVEGGFTYTWDQHSFNPIDSSVVNHIHFGFRDGSKMRKAFTYEWRFWNIIEIEELLREAGFSNVTCYWEGADEDGDGNGIFRPRASVEQETAWVAYIAAER